MSIPHPFRFGVTLLGASCRQEWIAKVHKVEDLSYSVLQVPDHLGNRFSPFLALMAAADAEAGELVQTYTQRWPAQENAIRDWLIPLDIDVNHGYAKTAVINSEMTKKREALHKRLENVQRRTIGARKHMHNASKLYRKRCQQTKERADELYRVLN